MIDSEDKIREISKFRSLKHFQRADHAHDYKLELLSGGKAFPWTYFLMVSYKDPEYTYKLDA